MPTGNACSPARRRSGLDLQRDMMMFRSLYFTVIPRPSRRMTGRVKWKITDKIGKIMKLIVKFNETSYRLDLARPLDISIPLCFDGVDQLSVFGTPHAGMEPFAAGGFIGSVKQGGSVNCEVYTIIPHCNGTHTECVGHIAEKRVAIRDILKDALVPATLVTVTPEAPADSDETYDPPLRDEDRIITRRSLEQVLSGANADFLQGLIIRTLPNGTDKKSRNYDESQPAFLSREGMEYIAARGIKHLLVDVPSVDRLMDEGKLTNHHTFWRVAYGSHDVDPGAASPKTVTELIYVADSVRDGPYILNLQIAPFVADASPSRPILYEVK